MLTVIQVVLIVIAALIVLLLAAPFEARARGEWPGRLLEVRASWGWLLVAFRLEARPGAVSPALELLGLTVWKGKRRRADSPDRGKKDKPEKQKKDGGKPGLSARETLRLLTDRELWREAVSFLRRLVRALRLEARLDGSYGTDDPALTGVLAGLIAALSNEKIALNLRPDFVEEVLDIEGYVRTRFYLGELIVIVLALLWRKPVRRLWLTKVKSRFKFKFKVKEEIQHV